MLESNVQFFSVDKTRSFREKTAILKAWLLSSFFRTFSWRPFHWYDLISLVYLENKEESNASFFASFLSNRSSPNFRVGLKSDKIWTNSRAEPPLKVHSTGVIFTLARSESASHSSWSVFSLRKSSAWLLTQVVLGCERLRRCLCHFLPILFEWSPLIWVERGAGGQRHWSLVLLFL